MVSLNVLDVVINPKTIRLQSLIENEQVSILVDSGSIHNFIQASAVEKAQIPISKTGEFLVTTGSGVLSYDLIGYANT